MSDYEIAEKFAKDLEKTLLSREVDWRIELAQALNDGKINMPTYKELVAEFWEDHVQVCQKVVDRINELCGGKAISLVRIRG